MAGRPMYWHAYGDRTSDFGWEMDHWWPSSAFGSNVFANMQPLHWRTNVEKSDRLPVAPPLIGASGSIAWLNEYRHLLARPPHRTGGLPRIPRR